MNTNLYNKIEKKEDKKKNMYYRVICSMILIIFYPAVEILIPDVLRPIPPSLTQMIRNFAKV
jgi:hypothetical protein